MLDSYGRKIEYMRVSITDRCNLRCRYCIPDGIAKVPMSAILTYEEITEICRAAVSLGISRFKITGGEPFARLGCTDLIRSIKSIEGAEEVTVTTNGQLLHEYIDELKDIGIDGINISLDTLDPERYTYITGGGRLENTLRAIELSVDSGIRTKINCLIQRGFNEDEILDMADLAFRYGIDVRFIELMPIGAGDMSKGVPGAEILEVLMQKYPDLTPDASRHGNGPAVYYKRSSSEGAIGFISAIHGKFCSSCNRIRLTSQGLIKPCLYYENGIDLKPFLADGEDAVREALAQAISTKPKEHHFGRQDETEGRSEHKLMSQIGG